MTVKRCSEKCWQDGECDGSCQRALTGRAPDGATGSLFDALPAEARTALSDAEHALRNTSDAKAVADAVTVIGALRLVQAPPGQADQWRRHAQSSDRDITRLRQHIEWAIGLFDEVGPEEAIRMLHEAIAPWPQRLTTVLRDG